MKRRLLIIAVWLLLGAVVDADPTTQALYVRADGVGRATGGPAGWSDG